MVAPADEAQRVVLQKISTRIPTLLTRRSALVDEQRQSYMADCDDELCLYITQTALTNGCEQCNGAKR